MLAFDGALSIKVLLSAHNFFEPLGKNSEALCGLNLHRRRTRLEAYACTARKRPCTEMILRELVCDGLPRGTSRLAMGVTP